MEGGSSMCRGERWREKHDVEKALKGFLQRDQVPRVSSDHARFPVATAPWGIFKPLCSVCPKADSFLHGFSCSFLMLYQPCWSGWWRDKLSWPLMSCWAALWDTMTVDLLMWPCPGILPGMLQNKRQKSSPQKTYCVLSSYVLPCSRCAVLPLARIAVEEWTRVLYTSLIHLPLQVLLKSPRHSQVSM